MSVSRLAGRVIVSSTLKAYKKAKKTGKLNLMPVALYELIAYYAQYTKGREEHNAIHRYLIDELFRLQTYYSDYLCDYKAILQNVGTLTTSVNTAPTVSNNSVDILAAETYTFKVSDFTLDYADAEQQNYRYLLIYKGAETNGNLNRTTVTETTVPNTFVIDMENYDSFDELPLEFVRTEGGIFAGETFTFRVSDNPADYLYSDIHTFTINASVISSVVEPTNLPATIGDNTITVANRTTTVFTLADFTSNLTPPYSDPEADLIDAIRIDEISTANKGIYYYNGVPIQVNDIITREDLNAGLLTHVGPDDNAIWTDTFNFSARDEGSQTWVQ